MTVRGFAGGAFIRVGSDAAPGVDDVPDQFTFTDQFNVVAGSERTSNAITVTGIDAPADITVTDGTYSINGGAFTADPGTVNNGDSVRARHTASGSDSTTVDTVIDIGGVTDTFSSTTAAAGGTASLAPVVAVFARRRRLLLS